MRLSGLLLCAALFGLSSAHASSGNDLLENCAEGIKLATDEAKFNTVKAARCWGFIDGFEEGVEASLIVTSGNYENYRKMRPYCTPEKVTKLQLTRVIVKFLQDSPADLHRDSGVLAMTALMKAFPCAERR